MAEAVAGPYQGGYFIAAYACPLEAPAGEYIGYFKLFLRQPASPWEDGCIFKGRCEGHHAEPERALAEAMDAGHLTALNLPHASTFHELRISGLSHVAAV